jgi:glycine cleavage system H protein
MPVGSPGQDSKQASRINPEGVSSCIWADAGLVSYKLCDRDFECEDCPFDRAMRQESSRSSKAPSLSRITSNKRELSEDSLKNIETLSELVREFLSHSAGEQLPAERFYSRNHLWAKKVEEGRYRIGVDKHISSLFHNPMSVILPQVGTVSRRNAPFAWIILEDGTIMARSPLDGEISKGNSTLRESPSLMNSDPYESGWICEIDGVEDKTVESFCFDEKAAKKFYDDQFIQLQQTIVSGLEHRTDQLGITMMDGGVKPGSLKELLGAQRYVSFLRRLLSAEV